MLDSHNLQFAKHFSCLQMSFCIFSKNCELLKSDTSWIFRVIHWTSYIVSYFKPIKYPLLNNNVISQKFIVHINFNLHTSFFSNYISFCYDLANCDPVITLRSLWNLIKVLLYKPYQILRKVTVVIKNAFRHKHFIFTLTLFIQY